MVGKLFLSIVQRFAQNNRGTTAIEFAVIAPLFFLVFFAVLEFGLIGFTQVVLQSAVSDVSRAVAVSPLTGAAKLAMFNTQIRLETAALPNGANISVSSAVVGDGGTGGVPAKPDICLTNPPASPPICPVGTAFQDINGNGIYDGATSNNLGGTGDLVELQVTLPWQVKFPFMKALFPGKDSHGNATGVVLLSASTILKNE